jgi:hypothetical protein
MKNLITFMILILSTANADSQNLQKTKPTLSEKYIVLANPTARNIDIIRFLTDKKIFNVNTGNIKFLGIYHPGQSYDFAQSQKFIEESGLIGLPLGK